MTYKFLFAGKPEIKSNFYKGNNVIPKKGGIK